MFALSWPKTWKSRLSWNRSTILPRNNLPSTISFATRSAPAATARPSGRSARTSVSRSPNGVMCHLKALEKKGIITREPNMSRAIQLTAESIDDHSLPLYGQIAAGMLHEAIEQEERVDFETLFDPADKNLFVLEVAWRVDDRGPDRRRRLCGRPPPTDRAERADRGGHYRRGRGHAQALVSREEPHPPGARQLDHEPIFVRDAKVLGVVVGVVRKIEYGWLLECDRGNTRSLLTAVCFWLFFILLL